MKEKEREAKQRNLHESGGKKDGAMLDLIDETNFNWLPSQNMNCRRMAGMLCAGMRLVVVLSEKTLCF